ncbi:DUF1772 domain-containing protein [Parvularcula flava]|uniref:DUF1772 domain-containing protein n=1 Tax=Aquisalinus luteolus TaxID=1566827 RepID=A0A8J3A1F6_9PROT|nr:anthrone oxygenase family protein [Aquisalinus luteolus]NHK26636.1 DUF1772 domain-containing protein [Aquisalinus luteolus]GGH92946.1 membrane protein [Aquisalinus luteolus]
MSYDVLIYASVAVGLSAALVAGVFQSFSDFVMDGLIAAEEGGMRAMQALNRTVMRSAFLAMLLGLVPVTVGLAFVAGRLATGPAALWMTAGAMVYVFGAFLVTIVGNVPMNRRLDRLDGHSPDGLSYWHRYGVRWTQLNHVRTLASAATAGCFIMAAVELAAGQG